MTGLNLESFLHLLRADLGAWATLGAIALVLALMAWTSWGSRRALRKCLVLSVAAHIALGLYSGTRPMLRLALRGEERDASTRERIRQIKVTPTLSLNGPGGATEPSDAERRGPGGRSGGRLASWDRPTEALALADVKLSAEKTANRRLPDPRPGDRDTLKSGAAAPVETAPEVVAPEARPVEKATDTTPPAPKVAPGAEDEVAAPVVARAEEAGPSMTSPRVQPGRTAPSTLADLARSAPSQPLALAGPVATPPSLAAMGPATEVREARAADNVETAPPSVAATTGGEVAPVEVIPARPDGSRSSLGEAALRNRSREAPANGVGGNRAVAAGPASREPIVMAVRPPSSAGPADGLATRPSNGGRGPASNETRPAAPTNVGVEEVEGPVVVKNAVAPLPNVPNAEGDVRGRTRPDVRRDPASAAALALANRTKPVDPLTLSRVTPNGVPALPAVQGATGGRPLADIPEVYRSRLDPNRSALAFRSGASPASEQAVERALDWLARHQDNDGRWDGATAKYDDGTAVKGDDDFTVHCPNGEPCFGECIYWEADTALTGLALLAYLGAGYTQADGKYAETVGKGIDFLLASQAPDGDLRGRSKAVGMYCHAMATIALCEAYALTGDERLRPPVTKAIAFLARSRARDGLAWRYVPGAPVGDTSILGWVVMALKSAREVGIPVPSDVQAGTLGWLAKVSSGEANGLARYQPQDNVTPTMTAEAWVCRQFLGVGGPGAASTEAAEYLLVHGPKSDTYNLYYWYYGTLAMYQHGGDAWYRWNGQVRDEIVRRQRSRGHAIGSWDPDDSPYGTKGGRIYCTALATLSLEVYYRYLRLYDAPRIPPAIAPSRPRAGERDPAVGRSGNAREPAPIAPRR